MDVEFSLSFLVTTACLYDGPDRVNAVGGGTEKIVDGTGAESEDVTAAAAVVVIVVVAPANRWAYDPEQLAATGCAFVASTALLPFAWLLSSWLFPRILEIAGEPRSLFVINVLAAVLAIATFVCAFDAVRIFAPADTAVDEVLASAAEDIAAL